MQLHQLKPVTKRKTKKRVGRGGKRGSYSGKGLKGQKARAGRKLQPMIRPLIKKYPKKRGYRFKSLQPKPAIISFDLIERTFKKGQEISPGILLEKKIIGRIKGKIPLVKILGRGKLTKPLIIKGCQVSKTAREKIKKAGGKIAK